MDKCKGLSLSWSVQNQNPADTQDAWSENVSLPILAFLFIEAITDYCDLLPFFTPFSPRTEGRLWTGRLGGPIGVLQPQLTTFSSFFFFFLVQMAQ